MKILEINSCEQTWFIGKEMEIFETTEELLRTDWRECIEDGALDIVGKGSLRKDEQFIERECA